MPRPSTFGLYDRIIDGGLERYLRTKRAEGLTFDDISIDITTTHGIAASRSTVQRWCAELEIPSPERVA